jgi:ribonuclease HI
MDALRTRGDCTATQLQRLNACRMYLQVARVSDIASADGTKLRNDSLVGKQSVVHKSTAKWPHQGRPPKDWWRLWRTKLHRVFSTDGESPQLRHRLGPWTAELKADEWSTVIWLGESGDYEVYKRRADGWYDVFEQAEAISRHLSVASIPSKVVDCVPVGTVPVDIGHRRQNGQRRVYFRPQVSGETLDEQSAQLASATTFAEYVRQQPGHISRMLHHCDLSDKSAVSTMDASMYEGNLDIGSDGSMVDLQGTFGFVIGNSFHGTTITTGGGNVPGAPVIMSSTRAELCGIFAAITYVRLAREYCHGISPRKGLGYTLYCDSKAALSRMSNSYCDEFGTIWRCRANYDLEVAIHQCLKRFSVAVDWQWVRGHAIKRKRREKFTAGRRSTMQQITSLQRQGSILLLTITIIGQSKKLVLSV